MSQAAHEFDPNDPHGIQSGHDHVILSWQLLVSILMILLFLTALTVFTAQAEQWVMDVWGITLPSWINLAGAMSIATVKALLVAGFFMQLKYDKPINSITMFACLICVWLFLMFCMIDLGNRDKLVAYRAETKVPGGTGMSLDTQLLPEFPSILGTSRLSPHVSTGGRSLAAFRAEEALANFPNPEHRGTKIPDRYFDDPYYTEDTARAFWHWYYEYTYMSKGLVPHHHERDEQHAYDSFLDRYHDELAERGLAVHHDDGHETSDANRSRPTHGLTPGLFDAHADSSHGSDAHAEDTHTEGGAEHTEPESPEPAVSDDH